MSGFGGFVPVSNNNNAVHQPPIGPGGVEPPRNGPVPDERPQDVPAGNAGSAGGAAKTQDLVRSLDVLLARAGKAAGQAVDEAALAKFAKGAKFDKATVDALRAAAKAANEAMRTLDTFTGADFAHAMVCDPTTKVVSWDERRYAGKAVRDALDKQQQLSNVLSKFLNDLPAKATAEQQAALEEAMLQCDRRIGEVETVILELTEIAEKGLFGIDDKTRDRLDRKVTELAGEKALEMHDRSLALQTFREQFVPVVERLDHYAAHPGEAVPKNDLLGFRRAVGEAKNALANAAKNGFVRIPKADGGTRDLFVDRSFLDEAAKLLGEAEAKLGKLRESAARDLRRKFVLKDAALPSVEILQPKFAARLRELGTTPGRKRQTAAVADFVLALDKFRKALLAYADNPSGSNKSKVLNALDEFRDDDRNNDWKAGLDFLLGANRSAQAENDPELHAALDAFKATFSFNKAMGTLVRRLENLVWNTEVMTDHIEALNLRAKSSDQLGGADAVRAVFFGEGSFTTLVESRVHGYADGDIDPALDDRNVAESRQLGGGNFNSVDLVTFKDGTKRVFKPEFAGRMAAENCPILRGIDSKQELTRINRAVDRTADALGLGDVMVKTTAGVHGGVFGMYMEVAPGVEGRHLATGANPRRDKDGNVTALGTDDIEALPADRRRIVRGRMMRQFNRLHWFDAITGQGDRHNANYMVQVKPDLTVVVKGIDNDGSFGATRIGLTKFRLPPAMARRYMDLVRNLSVGYRTAGKLALDAMNADPGFTKLRDGSIEVDVSKATSPLTVTGLYESTAFHQVSVPDEMDYELCQKLKGLKAGPERDALLRDWADKLGARSQQYRNAVNRLDEAIARAEQLERDGKVYRDEDWESDEVQNRILDAKFPLDPEAPFHGCAPTNQQGRKLVSDYKYVMAGNLYARDFGD